MRSLLHLTGRTPPRFPAEPKQVHIYAPYAEPRVETGDSVAGSGPEEGFMLDLTEVWSCYE